MTTETCKCHVAKFKAGDSRCLNCGRPYVNRNADLSHIPTVGFVGIKPVDKFGRPAYCYNGGTPQNAEEAARECVASGGSQQDAEREIRRVLCGEGVSDSKAAQGIERAYSGMFDALDKRDLPPGVEIRERKAVAGEAKHDD